MPTEIPGLTNEQLLDLLPERLKTLAEHVRILKLRLALRELMPNNPRAIGQRRRGQAGKQQQDDENKNRYPKEVPGIVNECFFDSSGNLNAGLNQLLYHFMKHKDNVAMRNLIALCLLEGIGVAPMPDLAYELVIHHVHVSERSKALLAGYCYRKGAFDVAYRLSDEALDGNDDDYAMLMVARCLLNGKGCEVDVFRARDTLQTLIEIQDKALDNEIIQSLAHVELLRCHFRIPQTAPIDGLLLTKDELQISKDIYTSGFPPALYHAAVDTLVILQQRLPSEAEDDAGYADFRKKAKDSIIHAANARYLDACLFVAHQLGGQDPESPALDLQLERSKSHELLYNLFAAGQHHAKAQLYVARALCKDANQPSLKTQNAVEFYTQAAGQDSAEAQFELGRMYWDGIFVLTDYKRAYEYFYQSASLEYPPACAYVGDCYCYGKGVKMDVVQAFEWYHRGAYHNDPYALCRLGECYLSGRGALFRDEEMARTYLERSHELGWPEASAFLAYFDVQLESERLRIPPGTAKAKFVRNMKAAVYGDRESQYQLGVCYDEGEGVDIDFDRALVWYHRSAIQGHKGALHNIGQCYYIGKGVRRDFQKAVLWYTRSAELGHMLGQYHLGVCYDRGEGVPTNKAKAVELWTKAAHQGCPYAQFNLGLAYLKGVGAPEDHNEAVKWFLKSAEQNFELAQLNLYICIEQGKGLPNNPEKAFEWAMKAAKRSHPFAMFLVGKGYYEGHGVKQNYEEAFKWFNKAAEVGDVDAHAWLGDMYFYGYGVPKNLALAREWYEKAANAGHSHGQYRMGEYCYWGYEGEEHKDAKKAFEWYLKAAKQDQLDSIFMVARMYWDGDGVQRDYAESVRWDARGAELGHAGCQCNLGYAYDRGLGVQKRDAAKAKELYMKAAENGSLTGQCNLADAYIQERKFKEAWELYSKIDTESCPDAFVGMGDLYYYGYYVEQDYKKALEYYEKAASRGVTAGESSLGDCYYHGRGVPRDPKRAVEIYSKHALVEDKAPDERCPIALNGLGDCYYYGHGVEQDYEQAFKLYSGSAVQNFRPAQFNLGRCYFYGHGAAQDKSAAIEWFQKSAEANYSEAQYWLGKCYFNGDGVVQNRNIAREYYEKAAEEGHADARRALDEDF